MKFVSTGALALAALGSMFLTSCGGGREAAARTRSPEPAKPVRLARAEVRPMERTIPATGTLSPQESSTISTKVTGRLQRLEVDLGSTVRQGDLLAQVEPRDYELRVQQAAAALAEARAALGFAPETENETAEPDTISSVKQARAVLEEAVKNLDRVRSLTQSRIASTSELDTAEAAHKVAQTRYDVAVEESRARLAGLAQRRAEYEIARKQLSDTSIRAPFDGAIQSRPASVGEYVATGTPIVTLVKIDPLRLRLEVPELDSVLVRLGQTVRLTVIGDSNVYTGRIARLSPALNETNRMLLVEADVPNRGGLRGGLFARAQIVINEHEEGLSVPDQALVTFAGIEKVITVGEGKALEKTVTTGRRGPGWVEVLSGIQAGTPVVLEPAGLRSGQPVSVTEAKEPMRTSALMNSQHLGPLIRRTCAKAS